MTVLGSLHGKGIALVRLPQGLLSAFLLINVGERSGQTGGASGCIAHAKPRDMNPAVAAVTVANSPFAVVGGCATRQVVFHHLALREYIVRVQPDHRPPLKVRSHRRARFQAIESLATVRHERLIRHNIPVPNAVVRAGDCQRKPLF